MIVFVVNALMIVVKALVIVSNALVVVLVKNAFAFVIFMIITIDVKFYCLLKNKSMLL